MKKILPLILVLTLLISMVACGASEDTDSTTTTTAATVVTTTTADVTTTTAPVTEVTTTTTATPTTTTTAPPTTPPEPEYPAAIKTAEDFAAMNPDGEYYLANDITVTATWNDGKTVSATYADNVAFTGILDGKGYTITTSAALFANFQGTVTNLTVVGEIPESKIGDALVHNAAVAMWTNGEAHFENVTTKANIAGGKSCGGLLGYGATGSKVTAINCTNDGNITCTDQVGGMFGYIQDTEVTITDCTNNGNLTTANYGAGIIGRFGRDAASVANGSMITITGCTNNGKIVSAKGQTGGILGYLIGGAVIKDCVNNGEIVNETSQAGGIMGSQGDKADTTTINIENCVNYGTIRAINIGGGIAGRHGRAAQYTQGNYRIANCINYGDIYVTQASDAALYAAGIAGYAYGGTPAEGVDANCIVNCINLGNVIADSTAVTSKTVYVGGITGYVNAASHVIKNNINAGNITLNGNATTVALIAYNKNAAPAGLTNNYSITIGEYPAAMAGDPAAAYDGSFAVTAEQLASGEVAYLLNTAAGETVFYQQIGIDAVPTLTKSDDGIVYKWEDGTYENVASATPIKTAEEFAAMTADGAYYLANDITINATWNGGKEVSATYADNTAFTGYFSGNGYTITTTVPMFANFQGTIKNLTIVGDITNNKIGETVVHSAAVGMWTNGEATFVGITSKVNITGSKSTGSLLGYGATGSKILAVNCVNDGDLNATDQTGGMFGYIQDNEVTIINCVNNGDIYTTNYSGGIIGRFGRDAADYGKGSLATIIGCVNNGKVVAAKSQVGGMIGYLIGGLNIFDCVNNGEVINETGAAGGIFGATGDKASTTIVYIEGCTNYGVIKGVTYVGGIAARVGRANQSPQGNYRVVNCTNYGEVQATATGDTSIYAAGVVAYAWGGGISAGYDPNGTVGNVNCGKVVVDATTVTSKANFVGGIIGYVNSANYEIKDNVNAGEIAVTGGTNNTVALIGYNKNIASVESGMFANNYALASADIAVAYAGDPAAAADATAAVAITMEQIASGALPEQLKEIIAKILP